MAKHKIEFESEYDKGDIVIFKKYGGGNNQILLCGIITSYYWDNGNVWYNISIGEKGSFTYTYNNGGDIAEWDILGKIEKNMSFIELNNLIESVRHFVEKGEE